MHLVTQPRSTPMPAPSPHEVFVGVPLSIVFADGDAIHAAARGASRSIRLAPPFHVSDEDAYLVLPEDIGAEIVDILRDGDAELLAEAMRDGLLVAGANLDTRFAIAKRVHSSRARFGARGCSRRAADSAAEASCGVWRAK